MKRWFLCQEGIIEWHDEIAIHSAVLDHIQDYDPTYFHFTVVRNPYHRLVSCFFDQIDDPVSGGSLYRAGGHTTFESFILGLNDEAFRNADVHWSSQAFQLEATRKADLVIRLEDLHHELPKLERRLGLQPIGVVSNRKLSKKRYDRPFYTYYDERLAHIVKTHYEGDFALGDYAQDLSAYAAVHS